MGPNNVVDLRHNSTRVATNFYDFFDLWDDDADRLWLHVVGIHAIDLWLYGHAKMVRIKT